MILNFYFWIVLSTLLKSILDVWYELNDLTVQLGKKLEYFGMLINTFSNIKKKSKLLIFCNTTRFSFEIPVENLNNLYMYMSTWDDILICKNE